MNIFFLCHLAAWGITPLHRVTFALKPIFSPYEQAQTISVHSNVIQRTNALSTDVSEEHITTIFKAEEEEAEQDTNVQTGGSTVFRNCVSSSAYSLTLLPKHRSPFDGLHWAISQKLQLFMTTRVKVSNPSQRSYLLVFINRTKSSL
jgi:hypothetical protein